MLGGVTSVFLALFCDFTKYLAPGERGVIQVIASDRAQGRVIFRYISTILHSTLVFEQYIVNETREAIELSTCAAIEVTTCSFRTIRGRTVVCAILDEIAFWRGEDSANPDKEILTAIRPSMASIPNSMLLVISSPYAKFGVLYEHYKDYYGKADSEILFWKAPTRVMNPTISKLFLAREKLKDPSAARAEYDAEPREDLESYANREIIEAAVVTRRYELPPLTGVKYQGFVDPSGGSKDSMTLAIAHQEGERRILDAIRERRPPFSLDQVVEEFAGLLKRYRVSVVRGDRYAGEWPGERFAVHGINYQVSDKPKSDLYRDFLPLLNSGQVELLDSSKLVNQLASLERRTARGGRDSIDHGPGQHDDLANACAGVLLGEMGTAKGRIRVIDPDQPRARPIKPIPEFEEDPEWIPVINKAGRLQGYEARFRPGEELRANLEAVFEGGKLAFYRQLWPRRDTRGRAVPLR